MFGPVSDVGRVCLIPSPANSSLPGVLGRRVKANVENWLLVARRGTRECSGVTQRVKQVFELGEAG